MMKKIETSIYTNAKKHGDDVSKIIELNENTLAAIIADGVSTCTSGRVASSFLVYYTEKYLKENFKRESGSEEIEDISCSAIEHGAQQLVILNSSLNTISDGIRDFDKKSIELTIQFENELENISGQINALNLDLDEKIDDKNSYARAHANIKEASEILSSKRGWNFFRMAVNPLIHSLEYLLGAEKNIDDIKGREQIENISPNNEIAELKNKIEKLQGDKQVIKGKIEDIDYLKKNIGSILNKKEGFPRYGKDYDFLPQNLFAELGFLSDKLTPILRDTLNENEKVKDVSEKVFNKIFNATVIGERLMFKTNICLAILSNRKRKERNEYRLYTFILGDPEVRVISIKNKDNKEVYFKNSNSALTSFVSNDATTGIQGSIDFKSISIKDDDFIILASDGGNIKYNKSNDFPYTYFINFLSSIDKSGKIEELSKSWFEKLEKEKAITDDYSLIAIKIK